MVAGTENLTIEQGVDCVIPFIWQDENGNPIDLTGYTARMQVRIQKSDESPQDTLTTENGRITLGGVLGTIDLIFSSTDTDSLDFDDGVYDLELVSGSSVVTRVIEGNAYLSKQVTK